MPVIPGVRTISQRPLYDRLIVAAATATTNPILFFVQPIGQGTGIAGGTKQLWDTNLNQASQLPFGKDFLVRSIRFHIRSTAVAVDVDAILENYALQLNIGDKDYTTAPLWFFPQGGGPFNAGQLSTAGLAATNLTFTWANGWPDPRAISVLDIPIRIGQGENFNVALIGNPITTATAGGTTLGTGLNMMVILDGEIAEPAQ